MTVCTFVTKVPSSVTVSSKSRMPGIEVTISNSNCTRIKILATANSEVKHFASDESTSAGPQSLLKHIYQFGIVISAIYSF